MRRTTVRARLASGGQVVVTLTVDAFSLSERDRAFVFEIVDRIREYESEPASPSRPVADNRQETP